MKKSTLGTRALWIVGTAGLLVGCGGESEGDEKGTATKGTTTLITPEGSTVTETEGCPRGPDGKCVDPDRGDCGPGEDFDVVQDGDGNVLDVICYPAREGNTDVLVVPETGPGEEPPQAESFASGNNDVLVLDGAADGADLAGDLDVQANNVTVLGEGPELSIIEGGVQVEGNNLAVRGVRIAGDVTVEFNNASFALCIIEGDVKVTGNNLTLAGCDVFGSVELAGNNAILVDSRIGGALVDEGANNVCEGNEGFEDDDADLLVDDGEIRAPLTCGARVPEGSPGSGRDDDPSGVAGSDGGSDPEGAGGSAGADAGGHKKP